MFEPVNEVAGRFSGVIARTISSTVFVYFGSRFAARLLGVTGTNEMLNLAAASADGTD